LFFGTVRSFARKRPALEALAGGVRAGRAAVLTGRVSPGGSPLAENGRTPGTAARTPAVVSPYGQQVRIVDAEARHLYASHSLVYFARRNGKGGPL
jgi:hypothetical protein